MKATSSCILLLLLLLLHYSKASAMIFENNVNLSLLMNSDNNGQVDAQDSANADELIGNGRQNLADNKDFIKIIRNPLTECLSQCLSGKFNRTTQKLLRDDCAAGTYSDASSDHKCVKCPNGTFSEAGAALCQSCDGVVTQNQSGCYVKPELTLYQCFSFRGKGYNCTAAIDGNTDDGNGKASCVTLDDWNNWWLAHFNGVASVHYVTVYSSMESNNTNQTIKFSIEIDGKPCAVYDGGPFTATTLRCNATGSSIRIWKEYGGEFSVCEVKVFGDKTSAYPLKMERCWQNRRTDDPSEKCENAIDGNFISYARPIGPYRATVKWYAYTERNATISNVGIFGYNIDGFHNGTIFVKINGKPCLSKTHQVAGRVQLIRPYHCNAVGSKVEIESDGNDFKMMFLHEVSVYGNYVD